MANHKKKKFSVVKGFKKLKKATKRKLEKTFQKLFFAAFIFSSHPVIVDVTLISVIKIYTTESITINSPQPQSSNCKKDTEVP